MTQGTQPDDLSEALFIADFYPGLGAWLAGQHASGYDAVAGRARFVLWLATHVETRDVLTDYVARAARAPQLSAAEETELATRIAAGRHAMEELAEGGAALAGQARADLEAVAEDGGRAGIRLQEASLRLVVSLAERYTGRGVPLAELVESGTVGLGRAVEKYDHTKGYRFGTFATWWVRQAITQAVTARAIIDARLASPASASGAGTTDELTMTERLMLEDLGREPTAEELAAELDLSPDRGQ